MEKAIPKRVSLDIFGAHHYSGSYPLYKRIYSMTHHNAAVYLNRHRISGGGDFDGRVLHSTWINVKDVLKAMSIPEEIINQIQFEDEK